MKCNLFVPEDVIVEDVPCPFGCMPNDEIILSGKDLFHQLPGIFAIVKCRECSLIRTNPRPTPETMGFYYPDNYGPYLGTKNYRRDPNGMVETIKAFIKKFIDFKATFIPTQISGKMLEVGCASGSFMHEMASIGWSVQGIEFSESAAEYAIQNGFEVHIGALEKIKLPKEQFDLIVGWMVFEHLHYPVQALQKLRNVARKSANLVFSVPNISSFEFKIFKHNCYSLHLPNHLYYYTPDSIRRLLTHSGWELIKIYHQRLLTDLIGSIGFYLKEKGVKSLGNIMTEFPEHPGYWNYFLFPIAWLFGLIGQTGRMTVWAKPKTC